MLPDRAIAVTSVTASRELDDAVLSRFTGQTEVRTVDEAERLSSSAAAQLLEARRGSRRARLNVIACALRVVVARIDAPPVLTGTMAGGAVAIVLGIVCVAVGLPLGLILFFSLGALAATAVTVSVVGRDRPGETSENRYRGRKSDYAASKVAVAAAQRRYIQVHEAAPQMAQLLEGMKAAAAHRLNVTESDEIRRLAAFARNALQERLLTVDCSRLSGPEFEKHLMAIFDVLGYTVEHCGRTGDQGVDLVLATGGDRVAVQAKCHSGSVGNDAVQEAHAGKTFHNCQRCAVVTNSFFTRSARELAASVTCTLIDGQRLPAMIRGSIRL